jgi:hypothetical protein
VATEHFWMSGMYWGLTALYLAGKLDELDSSLILDWVMRCQHKESGGFGGSERNDPHLLYTLSAIQILALYDRLDLVDAEQVTSCECATGMYRRRVQIFFYLPRSRHCDAIYIQRSYDCDLNLFLNTSGEWKEKLPEWLQPLFFESGGLRTIVGACSYLDTFE